MKDIDYKIVIKGYINQGESKDWLYGYIHCLYANKLILINERYELKQFIREKFNKEE